MSRLRRLRASLWRTADRLRALFYRIATQRARDVLAVVGVGCIAIGLASFSAALAWVVVGAFLLFVAGSGRDRRAA